MKFLVGFLFVCVFLFCDLVEAKTLLNMDGQEVGYIGRNYKIKNGVIIINGGNCYKWQDDTENEYVCECNCITYYKNDYYERIKINGECFTRITRECKSCGSKYYSIYHTEINTENGYAPSSEYKCLDNETTQTKCTNSECNNNTLTSEKIEYVTEEETDDGLIKSVSIYKMYCNLCNQKYYTTNIFVFFNDKERLYAPNDEYRQAKCDIEYCDNCYQKVVKVKFTNKSINGNSCICVKKSSVPNVSNISIDGLESAEIISLYENQQFEDYFVINVPDSYSSIYTSTSLEDFVEANTTMICGEISLDVAVTYTLLDESTCKSYVYYMRPYVSLDLSRIKFSYNRYNAYAINRNMKSKVYDRFYIIYNQDAYIKKNGTLYKIDMSLGNFAYVIN